MNLTIFGFIESVFFDKSCRVSSKQLHQKTCKKSDLDAETVNGF